MMSVVNTVAIVFSSETLDLFNMFRIQSCSLDSRISLYMYICPTIQAGGRDTDCSLVQGVSSKLATGRLVPSLAQPSSFPDSLSSAERDWRKPTHLRH